MKYRDIEQEYERESVIFLKYNSAPKVYIASNIQIR